MITLPLEDGKDYRDGRGGEHRVMGPTKDNVNWVWTLGGFWFVRTTGQKVDFNRRDGRFVHKDGSSWNLKENA